MKSDTPEKISILIVKDETATAIPVKELLEQKGYDVNHVFSSEDAVKIFLNPDASFDVILMGGDHEPGTDRDQAAGCVGNYTDITGRVRTEKKILETRDEYKNLFQFMEEGFLRADAEGRIMMANIAIAKMCEYESPDEMIGVHMSALYTDPGDRNYMLQKVHEYGVLRNYEISLKTRSGNSVWTLCNIKPIIDMNGKFIGTEGLIRDIGERKRFEQELKESESRFKALHDASFGGIAIHDKGIILDCNRGLSEMSGYSIDELIGMDGLLLVAEKSRDMVMKNILAGYEKPYEAVGLRKNGEEFPIRLEARNVPYRGKNVRTVEFRDITEAKQSEEMIKQQLREKEILLKEAHHRIKNNISSIEAMLVLQAKAIPDNECRAILQNSIGRIQSVRVIYDKLLLSDDYRDVSVKHYLEDLISALMNFIPESKIVVFVSKIDDFPLSVKVLFPLGTIVNELITNSLKYGFENKDSGNIEICLSRIEKKITLSVQDDGIGLPEGFDISRSTGFGLMLVKMLTRQLNGEFTIESAHGTRSVISFEL